MKDDYVINVKVKVDDSEIEKLRKVFNAPSYCEWFKPAYIPTSTLKEFVRKIREWSETAKRNQDSHFNDVNRLQGVEQAYNFVADRLEEIIDGF